MDHVFYAPEAEWNDVLPEEEALHCLKVMRLKTGDMCTLTDGKGSFFEAQIIETDKRNCRFRLLAKKHCPAFWQGRIHLALGPTKNMDRMEWLVEKATEIGVDEISFLNCRYSERRVLKRERIERIAISAMKQSMKAVVPVINEMADFNDFISKVTFEQGFIAHCHDGNKVMLRDALRPAKDTLILIGPEGDFSIDEVNLAHNAGCSSVGLGPSRLRTETAALVAVNMFNLINY